MTRYGLVKEDVEAQGWAVRWRTWTALGIGMVLFFQRHAVSGTKRWIGVAPPVTHFERLWADRVVGHLEAREVLASALRRLAIEGHLCVAIHGPVGVGKSLAAEVLASSLYHPDMPYPFQRGVSWWSGEARAVDERLVVVDDVETFPNATLAIVTTSSRNDTPEGWTSVHLRHLTTADLRQLVALYARRDATLAVAEALAYEHNTNWRGSLEIDDFLQDYLVALIHSSHDHAHALFARFHSFFETVAVLDAAETLNDFFEQGLRCPVNSLSWLPSVLQPETSHPVCFVSLLAKLKNNASSLHRDSVWPHLVFKVIAHQSRPTQIENSRQLGSESGRTATSRREALL